MKSLLVILSLSVLSLIKLSAQQPTHPAPADSVHAVPVDSVAAPKAPEPAPKEPRAKPEKRFKYGARAGVSSSFLSSNPRDYSVNTQIGFNAGIYLRIYLLKRLYLQPEINYYFNSYEFTRTGPLGASDLGKEDKVKTHDLQIPILAGYQLFNKKAFSMLVQTGPAININVGVSDNDLGITRDDFNTTYWSWIVDGQVRIAKITVNGGFVAGMSNYAYGVRNHSWYVGLGFSL